MGRHTGPVERLSRSEGVELFLWARRLIRDDVASVARGLGILVRLLYFGLLVLNAGADYGQGQRRLVRDDPLV